MADDIGDVKLDWQGKPLGKGAAAKIYADFQQRFAKAKPHLAPLRNLEEAMSVALVEAIANGVIEHMRRSAADV